MRRAPLLVVAVGLVAFALVVTRADARIRPQRERRAREPALDAAPAVDAAPALDAPPAQDPGAVRACPSTLPEGLACVAGGSFVRGSLDGLPDERPLATVTVDTFLMDVHEVTNADYERCIEAGYCNRPIPFRGYMRPRQPKVGVSWYDASAYCAVVGERLPTEMEFERASGGPTSTRFPWGDEARPCTHSVVETSDGKGCGRGTTWEVMSTPVGYWGLYEISGNVWEWVQDWYSTSYAACGASCEGRNPRGLCDGADLCPQARAQKSVRGGSWWYPISRATSHARRGAGAPNRGPHRFGFRCARDLDAPSTPPVPVPSPGSRLGPPFHAMGRPHHDTPAQP